MAHSIRIRSASETENNYEVEVEGGIEPKSGIGGRDHIENDGRRAVGRVVGGTDEYSYWGAKTAIRADDPGDLEISINGGAFKPATKYGATQLGDTPSNVSGGGGGGSGPSIAERKREAATDADSQYIDPADVRVIRDSDDYRAAWREIDDGPVEGVLAFAVADGTYYPGTIQATIDLAQGAARAVFCGNYEDPAAVRIPANHNIICGKVKDEHYRPQGMSWGRTQQVGPALYRDMAFPDGLGGKPVGGRYQGCDIHDIALYGGGELYLDGGTTVETSRDAYILRKNNADVKIDGDVAFASGDRLVTSDRDVRPDSLGGGLNRIRFANEI